jgi:hypothetical protein
MPFLSSPVKAILNRERHSAPALPKNQGRPKPPLLIQL